MKRRRGRSEESASENDLVQRLIERLEHYGMRDREQSAPLAGAPMLAGVPVRTDLVRTLADLVREYGFLDTADVLDRVIAQELRFVPLTVDEREAILRSLVVAPYGLQELRAVLLQEHEWPVREGL